MVIDRLTEVALPVGLLVGSRDKAFLGANDYMERKLPDVRRRTIEDGRHRLMRTNAADVADIAREVVSASGLGDGRLFVGSWSAWSADHDRPVETG